MEFSCGAVMGEVPRPTWAIQWQTAKQFGVPSAVNCNDLLGAFHVCTLMLTLSPC